MYYRFYRLNMKEPLWTQRYEPNVESLIQESVQNRLEQVEGMNIILAGPKGCGKTVAARALAKRQHGGLDGNVTEINVADFFNRSKKEIKNDPRFAPFLEGRSRMAKRDMINYVIKESTSYGTVGDSDYRTVILDNAESIREDFQQSLRRIIERHYETTQFILATRSPSSIIPAIKSRFFTIPVRKPTDDELSNLLVKIMDSESVEYESLGIRYVIESSNRNMRSALLTAQATAEKKELVSKENVKEVVSETDKQSQVTELLDITLNGEYKEMKKKVDDLLSSSSYTTAELIKKLNRTVEYNYSKQEAINFQQIAGRSDMNATEGQRGSIHITQLLTEWKNSR